MLILQRKKNERIQIGPEIEIVVTDILGTTANNKRVAIGINAPSHVNIVRSELLDRPGGGFRKKPGVISDGPGNHHEHI